MTDSGSARRDESNDMCFEAGRRFIPEIASIRDLFEISQFFYCACAVTAIAQLRMRRRKRRYLVEISTNLCADDTFWFSSSRRIE